MKDKSFTRRFVRCTKSPDFGKGMVINMEDYEENGYGYKLNIIKIAGYVLLVIVLFAIVSILIKDTIQKEKTLSASALKEKTEIFSKEVKNKKAPAKKEEQYEILIGKDGVNGANGKDGIKGKDGEAGKDGVTGSIGRDGETGRAGMSGIAGIAGENGKAGKEGAAGLDGVAGKDGSAGLDGKSAFEAAAEAGYLGTEEEFSNILSTVGSKITDLGDHVTMLDGSLTNSVTQLNDSLTSTNAKVDECFTSVSSGKILVAATITDKGIATAATDTFSTFSENIKKLVDARYNNGYIDGQASVNTNVDITYVRHNHAGDAGAGGGCYSISNVHTHSNACQRWEYGWCKNCRLFPSTYETPNGSCLCRNCSTPIESGYRIVCGMGQGQQSGYSIGCGMVENQIISATIAYQ